ncbi:MAG: fibronectin type III domain-containing protein, partial [Sphingobacteriales bacterium]
LIAQAQVTIPANNPNETPDNINVTNKPYGNYFGYERSAAIYTSTEIGTTGTIEQVGFFLNDANNPAASTPVVIYMKERTTNEFAAQTSFPSEKSGLTPVWSGNITAAMLSDNSWITVTLDVPFSYTGGTNNLEILVETNGGNAGIESDVAKLFRVSETPNLSSFQFWQTDGTPPGNSDPGTLSTFRPNVQLTFAATVQPCNPPTNLSASSVGTTTATLNFTQSSTGDGGTYTAIVKQGTTTVKTVSGITGSSTTVTGLTPGTTYTFTVQKNCTNGTNSSTAGPVSFTTQNLPCNPPTNLSASNISTTSAQLNFTQSSTGDGGTYTAIVKQGTTTVKTVSGITGSSTTVTGLDPSTTYTFTVQKNCDNNTNSTVAGPVSFTTDDLPCNQPTNLTATNVTTTTAQLNFTQSTTGDGGIYTAVVKQGTTTVKTVSGITGSSANVTGLDPGTTYTFTVQKNCTNGTNSSVAGPVTFTTDPLPC